jgi:hypothetical protein
MSKINETNKNDKNNEQDKNKDIKELDVTELDEVVGGGATPGHKPTLPPAPTF